MPLLLSSLRLPLARKSDRVELVELIVAVVIVLPYDREVYNGRLAEEANEDRDGSSFSLTFSFDAWGTPSHFELTFGTVGGSLADETPGNPTAIARPVCVVPRFFICSW